MFETNLSTHPYIEYFQGDSAEDLKAQLRQINKPFKPLAFYSVGDKHFAWVSLSHEVIKRKKRSK